MLKLLIEKIYRKSIIDDEFGEEYSANIAFIRNKHFRRAMKNHFEIVKV